MVGVLLLGSGDPILFSYLVLLIILIIEVDLAVEVIILGLATQGSLAGVYVPLQVLELFTVVLTLLDDRLDLVDAQQVEELEHADLPVLDLAQHGEGEHSDEGYHANRDETYQVDEKVIVLRRLHCVLQHQLVLKCRQAINLRHPVVVDVVQVLEQLRHFLGSI